MEIAIIAHDGKKADMVQFLNKNKAILLHENIKLIATGTTGSKAENAGFKVKKCFPDHKEAMLKLQEE